MFSLSNFGPFPEHVMALFCHFLNEILFHNSLRLLIYTVVLLGKEDVCIGTLIKEF